MTDEVQQTPAERLAEQAMAAHREGRLAEAEPLYLEVLRLNPADTRAMTNLGLLYMSGKSFARAEQLFAAALAREPAHPRAWDGRINALIGLQRFEDAQALLATPGVAEDVRKAAELRLRPHWAEALLQKKDFAGAETQLRLALAITPDDPEAHNDLARLYLATNRAEAALGALAAALRIAPGHAPSLINQGSAYRNQGRPADAEASYRGALATDPANTHAVRNLGLLLRSQNRSDEADALEAAAQALGVDVGQGHLARGEALVAAGRFDEAIAAFETAAAHGVDRFETLFRIGSAYAADGRNDQALAHLDAAAAARPDRPEPAYRRGFVRLATGDFAGGWPDYETRWRIPDFVAAGGGAPPQVQARLLVAPTRAQLSGRHVVAIGEQGVGDQIMFASILPDPARDAARLDVMCDDRLVGLLSNSFPGVRVRGRGAVGEADVVVAVGSLGHAYRTRAEDFPRTPYLTPTDAAAQRWAERLGPRRGRLRIGLSWRGGTPSTRLRQRSVSLDQLAPLLDLPDCEFVSLQYGDVAAELAAANAARPEPIRAFPAADIDDFDELAGLIRNLDLVVSVQTALVHLSGAIGAPVLTLVRRVPEWRYGVQGDAMPWYGSARLFRQTQDGDWASVIARIVEAVRQWPTA